MMADCRAVSLFGFLLTSGESDLVIVTDCCPIVAAKAQASDAVTIHYATKLHRSQPGCKARVRKRHCGRGHCYSVAGLVSLSLNSLPVDTPGSVCTMPQEE
jgi:hypothetical protein